MNFTKNLSKDKYESSFKSCQSRSFFSCLLNDSTGPKDVSLSLCLTALHRRARLSVPPTERDTHQSEVGDLCRRWAIIVEVAIIVGGGQLLCKEE